MEYLNLAFKLNTDKVSIRDHLCNALMREARALQGESCRDEADTRLQRAKRLLDEGLRRTPSSQALEQRQTAIPILASLSYEADKRGRSYLLQYESPDESGRLITLVTAESPSALLQGVNRLVEFDLWGSLQGDMAVWDPIDGVSAETSWVGPSFHVGGVDIFSRASFFFSQRPWLWIILLVAAALLFAATAVRLLRQQARQQ